MSDNVLETVRATVQDFLAPEMRTHGVRLENLSRRLDDAHKNSEHRMEDLKQNLEHRMEDLKQNLEHRIEDSRKSSEIRLDGLQHQIAEVKDTLRADMRTLEALFETLEVRFGSLEDLVRMSMRQIESDGALRERVALLEVRMPKQ